MNLLQFVEMGVVESALLSAGCFLIICLMSGLGSLFIQDEEQPALQSFTGLSFTACLALISVSLCAAFAKYVIIICILVSAAIFAKRFVSRSLSLKCILESFVPILIVYALFIAGLMSYAFSHVDTVDYNCHMIYCSAIPEEIFKADYYSRLRIIDVYPYEWSKFHMFNGCMTAVPLVVFPLKNIITFNLAKFATVSLLIGAVYEGVRKLHGTTFGTAVMLVSISLLYICANYSMRWTLFINNYSSFLIMGIVWLSMRKKSYHEAVMCSLVLALATSKSTITGVAFFTFSLYMLYKHYADIKKLFVMEWKAALYCIAFGAGCACMVLTGSAPASETLFDPNFVSNTTNASWMGLFYGTSSLTSLINGQISSATWWGLLIFVFYGIVLICHRKKILHFLNRYKAPVFYAFVIIIGIYLAYWVYLNDGTLVLKKRFLVIPLQFLCLYLAPVSCLFICCEKSMRIPARLFVVFAFIQFMILNADNGACNYCMLMMPLTLYISECTLALVERISRKAVVAVLLAMCLGMVLYTTTTNTDLAFIYVGSKTDYYHSEIELTKTDYLGSIPYEYNNPSDTTAVMLNSLKGNRIHYNVPVDQSDEILGKMSMSMRFVPKDAN